MPTGRTLPRERKGAVSGAVLAPGASAGSDQPALVAIGTALSDEGIEVQRIDFPYRLAGKRAPDRPAVLVSTITAAVAALAERLGIRTSKIAAGGRSMGGRMASMAVAEGLEVACLVLVSYPLHPPGKPERLRTEHFPKIDVPCLFVSGTRDAFGSVVELEHATSSIAGPITHVWIEGGDHGLRGKDAQVAQAVRGWLVSL